MREALKAPLDAAASSVAIAAAEVVAACLGQPVDDAPDELVSSGVLDRIHVDDGDVRAALSVLESTRLTGELAELWRETNDFDDWLASMSDLVGRLQKTSERL